MLSIIPRNHIMAQSALATIKIQGIGQSAAARLARFGIPVAFPPSRASGKSGFSIGPKHRSRRIFHTENPSRRSACGHAAEFPERRLPKTHQLNSAPRNFQSMLPGIAREADRAMEFPRGAGRGATTRTPCCGISGACRPAQRAKATMPRNFRACAPLHSSQHMVSSDFP